MNLVKFDKLTQQLKTADLKTISVEEIISILKKFEDHLCATITLPAGTRICRARIWELLPDPIPTHIAALSYNPEPSKYYGRAHLIDEIPFYGSITTEKMDDYFNAIIETLNVNEKIITRNYFAVSSWILQSDITVGVIGNQLYHAKETEQIRLNFISSFPRKNKNYSSTFDEFLSKEFTKYVPSNNDYEYKISGTYSSFLLNTGLPAIIFSSIASNGAGLNISLNKELIDKKILIPDHAVYGTLYCRYTEVIQEYNLSGPVDDSGIIHWKEKNDRLHPLARNYYTGASDNKEFQKNIDFQNLDTPC